MREKSKKKRVNVILDLDQTLIDARPVEDYDFDKNKEKAKKFKFHNMDGYYIVFERPGLQEFLDWLFSNFIVSVWTAATKDYALFVIDKIILKNTSRKLDYIFFDYHCNLSEDYAHGTKDLNTLWNNFKLKKYDKNNTIIIDDYDEVYNTQPKRCVMIPAFEFDKGGSENDTALKLIKDRFENTKRITKQQVKDLNAAFDM